MKVYGIFPNFEICGRDVPAERTQSAIALIARLTFDSLRSGGDNFHFTVDWRDPGAPPDAGVFHDDIAEPHVIQLQSDRDLMDRLRDSIDPNRTTGSTIRSIATCRAATFGYDGQVFLCLRHEDAPPVSPDETLAIVEARPDILVDHDWFDGWLRGD
jgi:hypothetical protein